MKRLSEMTDVVQSTILELLVTVSALLTPEQFRQLGPVLWIHCMDEPHAPVVASTCFLIMQFAEKQPEEFTALIETGLASEEAHILSQDVILDRNHRRPFKLQRPPVLFVATDIGSSLFVYEDDSDYKDINGHVIPVELRRRLSEIGWAQEDRVVDQRIQRIRTPMSLLPSQQLERLDTGNDELLPGELQSVSPEPSPTKSPTGDTSLVRRDSTPVAKSQGVKRRPVFVSALVALFPKLASMVADRDLIVASAAQELIADFMRDDPSLLSRTVFHLITGDEPSLTVAISTLRAFLHIRHALPPGMAHHILNHLTGYLKSSVRQADTSNPLRGYAYTIPVIAKLVNQVSKISIHGLNRILLVHGDDIGIVAHTMLALMTAMMKTYVEAEYHGNIRYTIEYAANRFYALHQESFIFQSFDVMAQILDFPHVDGPWIAGGIYALFSTLKGGVSASTPDAAGIHDLNKAQEQEALMVTLAEEVPQTFLASLKRGNQDKHEVSIPVREEYEGKRLRLDDLVRLFLTVIAHNPAIQHGTSRRNRCPWKYPTFAYGD
ncbi:hypothetical protein EW026_g5650 [Hermanssonia centrifuga]|uniref:Protein UNC80 C-terminal domain-containing protein n=1 Tax=Hermanssonia centrifuga TaxID=98765 RepID=A0A4S4KF77_9APHY|nr:hypothetical protein EW026_g5650 [Hermanssonia centrifuga]